MYHYKMEYDMIYGLKKTFLQIRHSKWSIFTGEVCKKDCDMAGCGLEAQLVADC